MSTARRLFFFGLGLAVAIFSPGATAAPALKHDLYLCVNLSGQGGIMGRSGGSQSGLYQSGDRETFTHLGPEHIRMYTLTHDPREVATLYVAALDGVLRTRDGGRSWRILTGWDMTEPRSIAVDRNAPDHFYAGLPDGIAVSRDRGATWTRMNDGIRRTYTQTITVDRTHAGRVLAGTELGIFLSEDGARSWGLVQATAQTTYDLRQSPHDPKYFVAVTAQDGALVSSDSGRTWRPIPGVPADRTLHNCDFDARAPGQLLVCGWGAGVMLSEDNGRTWVDRSGGLPKREVWRARFDPDIPGRIYAAPYLAPLHVSDDLGRTWRPLQFEKAIVFEIAFLPRP